MTLALKPNGTNSDCGCSSLDYCVPFGAKDPTTSQVRIVHPGNRDWVDVLGYPACGPPPAHHPCGTLFHFFVDDLTGLYDDLDFVAATAPDSGTLDRLVFDGSMPRPAGITPGLNVWYAQHVQWGLTYGNGFGDPAWAWHRLEMRGPEDTQIGVRFAPDASGPGTTTSCLLKVTARDPAYWLATFGLDVWNTGGAADIWYYGFDAVLGVFRWCTLYPAVSVGGSIGSGGPLLFTAGVL